MAAPVAEWTQRLGHWAVRGADRAESDLEVRSADLVEVSSTEGPWVALTSKRLSAERQSELRALGALAVLDGHHGLLDLAFAYAEHLFVSRAEQRAYGLSYGQLEVHLRGPGDADMRGRLVGLNRCGAWVDAPSADLARDALVELEVPVGDRQARIRGRVVCDHAPSALAPRLLGLELALESCEGFPRFRALARARLSPGRLTGRSA